MFTVVVVEYEGVDMKKYFKYHTNMWGTVNFVYTKSSTLFGELTAFKVMKLFEYLQSYGEFLYLNMSQILAPSSFFRIAQCFFVIWCYVLGTIKRRFTTRERYQ